MSSSAAFGLQCFEHCRRHQAGNGPGPGDQAALNIGLLPLAGLGRQILDGDGTGPAAKGECHAARQSA